MKINKSSYFNIQNLILRLFFSASIGLLPMAAQAVAPVDFATTPLANTPLTDVKPNMLYVMDDSGSMARDYMPDWANDNALFFDDASYNSLAYNPAIVYYPPVNFTSGGVDKSTYPSQTGLSVAEGADFSATPNWKRVKSDPYLSTSTTNLEGLNSGAGPQFWVTIPAEYCKKADLKECNAQTSPTATYSFPAPIRWCNSSANAAAATPPAGSCQGTRIESGTNRFNNLRAPAASGTGAAVATITFTSASSTPRVTSVRVGGQEILRRQTSQTNSLSSLANDVTDNINDCTNFAWGNCSVSGYSASVSGNTVTIYAPTATTATPVVSFNNGNLSGTVTAFATPPATPGGRKQVTITPATTSYPYPGRTTKAPERVDCAGTTCTYREEMTNYANWYAYYRTRILMMKTSTALAFEAVGDDFRVGYMTIHPGSNQRINLDTFSGSHKANWYQRLFKTTTGSATPLRLALSQAGRIFANKETINGTFTDPMEYECQENFTLLTTDGYWNTGDGKEINGTTTMRNYDASPAKPPYYEGPTATSNTLADVAKYYRDTDLRTAALGNCTGALGTNVCESASTSSGPAPNTKQSMATLTLGLGVDGTITYSTDYKTATVGDFADIKKGVKNWPVPSDDDITTVDDLWHAAVNGDGTYFSAKKPTELVQRLREAIASISVELGNGATAAATSLNPVSGSSNFFYISSYVSGDWTGNLEKRSLDLATRKINPTAVACVEDVVASNNCFTPGSVQPDGAGYSCVTPGITDPALCSGTLVGTDCKVPLATSCTGVLKNQATRRILFNGGGSLQPFDYNNLTATQQANFDPAFLKANLTQGPAYTPTQEANLSGVNLVNYLKGATDFDESATDPDKQLFRKRNAILGDLVNSEPVFIGPPSFDYGDSGYTAFKAAQAGRRSVIYVGSNDGMAHAFDADTLQEIWAFVPSMVIRNMWRLADSNYAKKHAFYVNGDFQVGDICVATNCDAASGSDWRTILVGSLESGGRGYFALDITDPNSPQLLWEFDASAAKGDVNLGFSYGKAVITKRASDGKWVVMFSSGYNNIPDNNAFYSLTSTKFKPNNPTQYIGGDGIGRLYVVDAKNGAKLATISTNVGSVSSPSGLGQIAAITPNSQLNNLTTYVYGGDLMGNVWRFNISNNTVTKFAELIGPNGAQPVTVRPNAGSVGGISSNRRIILVGTGKYLEVSDLSNTDKQTLYGITDDNAWSTPLVNPRASLIQQVLTTDPSDPDTRTITSYTVDLKSASAVRGWYIDLPDTGERQDVNAQLIGTNLLVPTTVTESTACQPDGYSWQYQLNYRTGSYIVPGAPLGNRFQTRTTGNAVLNIDGKPVNFRSSTKGTVGDRGEGQELAQDPSGNGFQLRRSIWRELVN